VAQVHVCQAPTKPLLLRNTSCKAVAGLAQRNLRDQDLATLHGTFPAVAQGVVLRDAVAANPVIQSIYNGARVLLHLEVLT
jgi:hypothetical protein